MEKEKRVPVAEKTDKHKRHLQDNPQDSARSEGRGVYRTTLCFASGDFDPAAAISVAGPSKWA